MMKGKIGGSACGGAIVVGLIILLASITVFAPLTTLVINFFKSGGSASLCTLSLFEGKGIARCPIDDVIIYSDKVEIKYGEKEKYELLAEKKTSTNEMANEALAKLLLTCLQRGGGLNSRAFARSGWFNSDRVCMECAQITIDKNVLGNINGLAGYLNANKPKGGISDKKYIELLTKNEKHLLAYMEFGEAAELVPSKSTIAFEFIPGNDYTAFFVGLKKGSFSKWWGKITAVFEGNFIKAVVGNSDTYYTYIAKPSKLGSVCEKKVN